MKMNQLVKAAAVLIALAIAAPSALALTPAQKTAVKKAVTSVAPPEMPAVAAELVVKAAKEDREGVAVEAVRAAIYKNRSVAASVVAAVAKVAPDLAPIVAMNATQMERNQVGAISSAAIAAAPTARAEISSSAKSAYVAAALPASATANGPVGFTASSVFADAPAATASSVSSPGFSTVRGGASGPSGVTITQTQVNVGSGTQSAGPSVPVNYATPRGL